MYFLGLLDGISRRRQKEVLWKNMHDTIRNKIDALFLNSSATYFISFIYDAFVSMKD
jgi:hypothetical protein